MRLAQCLISRLRLAQVPQNRSVKRVQGKQVGPTLDCARQWTPRVGKSFQLIVGEREIVLHLRRLWLEFRGACQRLERALELAMLAVENSERCQLVRVIRVVQLVANRPRLFARAPV